MSGELSGEGAKDQMFDAVATLYPWIKDFQYRPLRDYAAHLYDDPQTFPRCEVREGAFDKLLNALRRAGRRAGFDDNRASAICADFRARPVLQTGPHLMLASEPEAYYSHIFSLLGLCAHGTTSYVSYAVSTVSLAERAFSGPGWAEIDGSPVNLFGLSRNRMSGSSLLAGPGRFRFELVTKDARDGENLRWMRSLLPSREFERPAHALKAANQSLWPELFGDGITFLQLDDEDVADLVVDHLSGEVSWLRDRLFEGGQFGSDILREIDRLADSAWAGWLTRGTDFFWLYEGGKRLPLRLVGRRLVNPLNGNTVADFSAAEICAKLTDRCLVPNLLLMFLVTAILPGIRVLGGSRHPVYYPLMRSVVVHALESASLDKELRNELARDERPAAWGHRVIECGDHPLHMSARCSAASTAQILARMGTAKLSEAYGRMTSFVADPLWHQFVQHVEDGSVSVLGPEWAYS